MKDRQIASASVKETIREEVSEKEEDECIEQKIKERADLVDKDVRVSTKKIQMEVSVIKYYCGERSKKVSNGESSDECPW